jgi:hypothetical protein
MTDLILLAAFILAMCILCALYLQWQAKKIEREAKELERRYDAARKSHWRSSDIGREFVRAKCRQLDQECA